MASSPPVFYDVHQIISVQSDVTLPELEPFRSDGPIAEPTVRVRIGPLYGRRSRNGLQNGNRHIEYHDGFGRYGFAVDFVRDASVQITASPLLRQSPHVLYTNAVEPLLRWLFVERGFALVHGACVSRGDDAYLITARTDTGKTTTILRLLDHEPSWSFLSDDLTLLTPDGRVLMYPKPLTISRHTLSSVRSASLTQRERFFLPFQSRLHSRSGRRFGLFLAKTRLPMATTNAITQLLVPPPKYPVTRLIPGVKIVNEARLVGLIVIERGENAEVSLSSGDAINILMANCEDAFGFPPYSSIKHFFYDSPSGDLRPRERATVTTALAGVPAVNLRSSSRDWWQSLPRLAEAGFARFTAASPLPVNGWNPLMPVTSAGSSD